jgi:hypothetical protein
MQCLQKVSVKLRASVAVGLVTIWGTVFADVRVALLAIVNAVRIHRMKLWQFSSKYHFDGNHIQLTGNFRSE